MTNDSTLRGVKPIKTNSHGKVKGPKLRKDNLWKWTIEVTVIGMPPNKVILKKGDKDRGAKRVRWESRMPISHSKRLHLRGMSL